MKSVHNVYCMLHISKSGFGSRYCQVFFPKKKIVTNESTTLKLYPLFNEVGAQCALHVAHSRFKKGISFTSYIFPLFNKISAHGMDLRSDQRRWQVANGNSS